MRLSVDAQGLSKTLARAARFAGGSNALAMQQAFKLVVSGNVLEVSATDLTIAATGRVTGDEGEDGMALVSAKLLAALTKSLSGKVELRLEGDTLSVRSGKAKYALAALANPERFPRLGAPEADATRVALDVDDLSSALAAVVFAASKDETRPVLMGVRFSRAEQGDALHLLATDGIRVSQATVPIAGVPENFGLTVPATALRRLPLDGQSVTLVPSGKMLYLQAGDWEYQITLMEGEYPQVLRQLPAESDAKAVVRVSRQGLRQAAARMRVIETGYIRLNVGRESGELILTGTSPQVGNAYEVLEAKLRWQGHEDGLQVALNPAYLAEALEALEEDEAELRIVGSLNPVTLIGRARRHDILPVAAS